MNIVLSLFLLLLSAALTKVFCVVAKNTLLVDKPNERTLHSKPTVRGGGLVFIGLSLFFLPLICWMNQTALSEQLVLITCIILLAGVSFIDDLYHLSVRIRFLIHSLVAVLIALFMQPEQLDFILFSITNSVFIFLFLFFIVIWAINHFNFMDGLDGFCASQAVFLCIGYALFFALQGAAFYQDFCLILAFSLVGFLVFNFPPAKIFMGDVGSASLGLITFSMALIAQQKYDIPILYWFMLNALFLFDSTITLLRRMLNKENWFAPHKKHAYQRLKQLGMDSRFILSGQAGLNGLFLLFVILSYEQRINIGVLLLVQMSILITLYYRIDKRYPMHEVG